jgi:hypothetical protein
VGVFWRMKISNTKKKKHYNLKIIAWPYKGVEQKQGHE